MRIGNLEQIYGQSEQALIGTADVRFIFDEAEAERYSLEVGGF
jgi:hypothetical protein